MNPDRVIGVAILDTSGPHHWIRYFKVGKKLPGPSWDDLPVLPANAPRPAEKLPSHFPENCPWRYTIAGDTLTVSPSIRIGNDFWHNDGVWMVKFVPAVPGTSRLHQLTQLAAANEPCVSERLRDALANWDSDKLS